MKKKKKKKVTHAFDKKIVLLFIPLSLSSPQSNLLWDLNKRHNKKNKKSHFCLCRELIKNYDFVCLRYLVPKQHDFLI